MKPEIYILSLANGQYYIGSTHDVERRLIEHNSGKTKSIRHKLPARLVFRQEIATLPEARKTEYKLKQKKSKRIIETIITSGKIEIK
ncbi:MAG: GIY-YIG nuclease family protein [Patescibacteria group bacterium]|jgi:putative endonuclease